MTIPAIVGLLVLSAGLLIGVQFAWWAIVEAMVRSAADDAARSLAVEGANPMECELAFVRHRADLFPEGSGAELGRPRCDRRADEVWVEIDFTLPAFVPGFDDRTELVVARAQREAQR